MVMAMPRDSLVKFNSFDVSDHNRETVEQSFERIESRVRTARGRMRKSYVADKMSFTLSWSTLPQNDIDTIDGKWGAKSLISFYKSTPGEFTLSLTEEDGTFLTYDVVFNSFSYTIVHRFDEYYYDIDLTLEEV